MRTDCSRRGWVLCAFNPWVCPRQTVAKAEPSKPAYNGFRLVLTSSCYDTLLLWHSSLREGTETGVGTGSLRQHRTKLMRIWGNLRPLQGTDLMETLLMTGPMEEHQAAEIIRQLLEVLAYCHSHGVVHRVSKLEKGRKWGPVSSWGWQPFRRMWKIWKIGWGSYLVDLDRFRHCWQPPRSSHKFICTQEAQ
jgi:hypothetical protein